jgi:hypothetical protein
MKTTLIYVLYGQWNYHLNYTTNCNSLNKLWEQSLWYLSLVCTVWHNSELTWFILDNLADMSVNAGCAFSDRLTHIKELACCRHRFSSQQMLDLQFIVVLRYSWVDMYFAHTLVSRMSLMLALMSQIYRCWSAEIIRKLETFLHQNDEGQLEHMILLWDMNLLTEWGYSLSSLFRCHIMFFKFWLVFLTALSLQANILSLQLTSLLFLSKLKDWDKTNKKMKEWIDIKSEWDSEKECVFCSLLLNGCSTHHYNIIMLLFAFNCCNQPHSFNVACIISQLALALTLSQTHVTSCVQLHYIFNDRQTRYNAEVSKNDVDSNNSVFINMTQVTWVTFKEGRYWTDESYDWELAQNNELNIINMKSKQRRPLWDLWLRFSMMSLMICS